MIKVDPRALGPSSFFHSEQIKSQKTMTTIPQNNDSEGNDDDGGSFFYHDRFSASFSPSSQFGNHLTFNQFNVPAKLTTLVHNGNTDH